MPTIASNQVMRFTSKAVSDDALQITGLTGHEHVSAPYAFTLELASQDDSLDFAKLLEERAVIHIKQPVKASGSDSYSSTTLKIHGWLASFEQVGKELEWVKYRAVLVPGLWKAGLTKNSAIFQDVHIVDMVKEILTASKYGYNLKVDISRVTDKGPKREYVAQYQESDLNFISRWLEHEGIYYYFKQDDEEEVLVLADAKEGYGSMAGESTLRYKPRNSDGQQVEGGDSEAASDDWFKEEVVTDFSCRVSQLPKEVMLKDYNWKNPRADMLCSHKVHDKGIGTVYEYNNHYSTKDEGKKLAKVRAQALAWRQELFAGRSECRGFRAGLVFKLDEHFRGAFNQEYMLVEVTHHATQALALGTGGAAGASYHNTFVAIPKAREFRPERKAKWPEIKGVMHGTVDGGSNSTPYAQVDDKGRYKVQIGFDRSGTGNGTASKYVRKQEPYAGPNQGMHFPLLKGSEVMITHIDGNPDRPVITGAVFNGDNAAVVSSANQTQNRIATPGGTQILMDDTQGATQVQINTKDDKTKFQMDATTDSEKVTVQTPKNKLTLDGKSGEDRIVLETDNGKTKIRLGKSADEPDHDECKHADGMRLETEGEFNHYVKGDYNLRVEGAENKKVTGNSDWTWTQQCAEYKHGEWFSLKLGLTYGISLAATADFRASGAIAISGGADFAIKAGLTIGAEFGISMKVKKEKAIEVCLDGRKLTIKKDQDVDCEGAYNLKSKGAISVTSQGNIKLQAGVPAPPSDPSFASRMRAWAAGAVASIKAKASGQAPPAPPAPVPAPPAPPTPNIEITSSSIKLEVNPTTSIELAAAGITIKSGAGEFKVAAAGITSKPMVQAG
ncbi:MAG: type VI secretion system tip protein VgrG [Planctomycetes bacterium]|jgi:type VI secretion system secreted protein VgrG|nr:type VI secretion system tip protein VgrG [Planctomycetota bacterium]MCL4729880.1 type VI secretion system tip protein VgrG [Planctomycetota bacterium]